MNGFSRFGKIALLESIELFSFEKRKDRSLAAEPDFVLLRYAVELAHEIVHPIERRDVRRDLLRRDIRHEEKMLRLMQLAAGKKRYDFNCHFARFLERGGMLIVRFILRPRIDAAVF